MARTDLAVAVVVGTLGVAAPSATAAPPPVGTVVLHVADYARVPASELADAEAAAAKAYARAGVRLVWTGGAAATAAPDGALHLDVLLLTAEMTARLGEPASALGKAGHEMRKAFIFYERIVMQAMRTLGDPSRTLGYVLAHEIGHMILPEYSHAPFGLLRSTREGSIVEVPDFVPAQAAMIRRMVTAAN